MTVRTAELGMAILLGLVSLGLMWKSAELEIGWVQGEGPGGGAWPFWLAAAMAICCVVTIVRWFRGTTPQSRSAEPYMDRTTLNIVFTTVGSLTAALLLTHWIGMYFALMLFLAFYLRWVGTHTWKFSLTLAIGLPVAAFFFFEGLLKIILPKGVSEPLFYPLYGLIY